jgi:broad specificity phosphatase PhoE
MAELATPGSTVLFASAQTIDDVLSLALNIDEESGLNVSFSLGGVTIIDFDDLGGGACVACVNVTSHLTS